ncbi:hypothetical protein [Baaleninema sp.]|uniref:hypothetical protein n=1 Tax=Baaleninema sp. TaxID=3101197 RepID=UPI003D06B10D
MSRSSKSQRGLIARSTLTVLAVLLTSYVGIITPRKYGPIPFGISAVGSIALAAHLWGYWRGKQEKVNKFNRLNKELFEESPSFWNTLPLIDNPNKIEELRELSHLYDRKLYPEDFQS